MSDELRSRARQTLSFVREALATNVAAIKSLYRAEVKVTIVIRIPGMTRGHVVFGDDDPALVIETIKTVTSDQTKIIGG